MVKWRNFKLFEYVIYYALNKEELKEPISLLAETYTDAYVRAMLKLPDDAEITKIYLKVEG